MEIIRARFAPDGTVKVTVECVSGASCMETSRALEKALGITVKDDVTPDYYETPTELVKIG